MGTGGLFPGGKARPGRDADHSPPSSVEVENEELYLLSLQTPPRHEAGQLLIALEFNEIDILCHVPVVFFEPFFLFR
jgi:hypothetical protein